MNAKKPEEVIHVMIAPNGYFPGNPRFPLLIYRQVFSFVSSPAEVQGLLKQNEWTQAWADSIYDFHHYHCSTHEVLVIISGSCEVQFGGKNGSIYKVNLGDVVMLPAGVSHKSLIMSQDFQCIGAYPLDVGPDMNYGDTDEYAQAIEKIKHIGLPNQDPVFGEKGLLFDYWR